MSGRGPLHAAVIDDELLLWDPESETLHRLNRSAAYVWRVLMAPNGPIDAGLGAELTPQEFDACRAQLDAEQLVGRTVTGRFWS